MKDRVYYIKMTDSILFALFNESIQQNYPDRNIVRTIGRDLFSEIAHLVNMGLCPMTESEDVPALELQRNERKQWIGFLNQFMVTRIDNIVQDKVEFSPERFLLMARFFLTIGERRMASECLWGMAAIALSQSASGHGIELKSHNSLRKFCKSIGDRSMINWFDSCQKAHSEGFYDDSLTVGEIKMTMEKAEKFVEKLRSIPMSKWEEIHQFRKSTFV